jgi:hypothetical protein
MVRSKTAIARLLEQFKREQAFRDWFLFQRNLESVEVEQIDAALASAASSGGRDFEKLIPVAPWGKSPLDTLDREALYARWQAEERQWRGRTEYEIFFFEIHLHWPEDTCSRSCQERTADAENVVLNGDAEGSSNREAAK